MRKNWIYPRYAELRIRVLEERLRLIRIEKYGAGGEKLLQAQMQLFELEPVVSEMNEQTESEHAPVHRSTKKSVKHPGRQELPVNLPRVERILPCALDQRVCKRCGKETVVVGYEESSQLDVEPAKYFVLVTKREKRACRSCEELGVVSAPLPRRIIERCLASDRIVIDTVVSKYCNHTPLHRQSVILERDIGLEISRATLDGWVLKVGELLIPMVAAMRRELISGSYIQADETPGLIPSAIIAGNRLLDLLKLFPAHVTLVRIRNQRQPLLPRFATRALPWLPTFIVCGTLNFSVSIRTPVNRTGENPVYRTVRRTFPTGFPMRVARWHYRL